MKSVFDKKVREELVSRISSLTPESTAQWGSMTVTQMVKHCILCEEYYFGNIPMKRAFIGRIFGQMAIRMILKNEQAGIQKNSRTPDPFKVTETGGDLEREKAQWVALIDRYETFGENGFTHWFFGKMSKQQLGQFIYKHSNHHLTQFGV